MQNLGGTTDPRKGKGGKSGKGGDGGRKKP